MRVHNVQSVSDISLRNIYQKASADAQNMTMSNPRVTSLRIRNIYNRFRQAPTALIKLLKPTVLSLALRNLYNKLDTQRDSFSINLPSITFIEVRPLLQKLRTWGLDETFKVTLPNDIEIHKKDVVSLYVNPDILEIKIDTPEPLEVEVKNILNKSTQRGPDFEVSLPDDIEVGGSVKPVLTFPVLEGEITEHDTILGVNLKWDDSSITHTGYILYRDLVPIPVDTSQEPYMHFGRDVKQFDDPTVNEDTTYYYRVTPKTVYGKLFSNQVMLMVPISLRAPGNVTSTFSSLSEVSNVSSIIGTMGEPILYTCSYDSLSKPTYTMFTYEPSLDFTYVTFESSRLHRAVVKDKTYSGLSTLLELSAEFSTQQSVRNFIADFNSLTTAGSAKHSVTTMDRPVYMDHLFAGLTVVDANDPYVRLDSAVLDPKQEYTSHSNLGDVTHEYQGLTTTGDLVGEFNTLINVEDIQSFVDTHESVFGVLTTFKSLDNAIDVMQSYGGLTDVMGVKYSLVDIDIVDGSSTFESLTGTNQANVYVTNLKDLTDVSFSMVQGTNLSDLTAGFSSLGNLVVDLRECPVIQEGDPHWDNVVALLPYQNQLLDAKGNIWRVNGKPFIDPDGNIDIPPGNHSLLLDQPRYLGIGMGQPYTIEAIISLGAVGYRESWSAWAEPRNSGGGEQGSIIYSSSFRTHRGYGASCVASRNIIKDAPLTGFVHISEVYDGEYLQVFVDGVGGVKVRETCGGWKSQSQVFEIGQMYLRSWSSYRHDSGITIKSLRVTKGIARYTEDFIPPTEPFPDYELITVPSDCKPGVIFNSLTETNTVNQSLSSLTGTSLIQYSMSDVPMLDDLSQEYTSLDSTERVSSYAMTLEGVYTQTSSCSTTESCKIDDNSYSSLDSSLVMEPVYSSYSKPMTLLGDLTTLENVDNIYIHNSSEMVLDMYYKGFSSLDKARHPSGGPFPYGEFSGITKPDVKINGYWVIPEEPKIGSKRNADMIYMGRSGDKLVYFDTRNDPANKKAIIKYKSLDEGMWNHIQQPDGTVVQDVNTLGSFGPAVVPAIYTVGSTGLQRVEVLPFFDDLMIAHVFRDHRYEPWATKFYDMFYNSGAVRFSSASIEGSKEEGLKVQAHAAYFGIYVDAGNYQEDPEEHTAPLLGLVLPEPEPYFVQGGVKYSSQDAVKILNATMPWEPKGLP